MRANEERNQSEVVLHLFFQRKIEDKLQNIKIKICFVLSFNKKTPSPLKNQK
jgi:hypothetical protein